MAATETKRVALLAREGKARDKLRQTLVQIGAELVLEADPNAVDAAALQSVHPQALLIALEPAVENALDKLDATINGGGYAVIFDDADVAAQRDGWDAQRWSRHLAAKLHGHADVLPPGREDSDGMPSLDAGFVAPAPRAATTGFDAAPAASQQEAAAIDFGDFSLQFDADAASGAASTPAVDAPLDFGLSAFDAPAPESAAPQSEQAIGFGTLAFADDAASGLDAAAAEPTGHDDEFAGFDFSEINFDTHDVAPPAAPHAGLDFSDLDFKAEEVSLPSLDDGDAQAAPATDAASGGIDFGELSLGGDDVPLAPPPMLKDAPAKTFDLSNLSLEAIEAPVDDKPKGRLIFGDEPPEGWTPPGEAANLPPPAPFAAPEPPPVPTEAAFGRASFSIVDDEPSPPVAGAPDPSAPPAGSPATPGAPGAVLLFAGMGGPDAVRRVLAELPRNFPRPVLVHQHLDGGSYANLVRQLERVAKMPVALAVAGGAPSAATVYVVPGDVAVQFQFGGVSFGAGASDFAALLPALPPHDSAVLLLSGADKALVEPAHALSANGAFVAGQSAQNCYDPAAAKALAERGCESAAPNELAAKLAALW